MTSDIPLMDHINFRIVEANYNMQHMCTERLSICSCDYTQFDNPNDFQLISC